MNVVYCLQDTQLSFFFFQHFEYSFLSFPTFMVSNEKSAVNYIEDSLYEMFPPGKQDVFTSFALERFYRFLFLKKKQNAN